MKKKNAKIFAVLMSALLVTASIVAPIFAQTDASTVVGYSADRVVAVDTAALTDLKTIPDATEELDEDAYKITDVAGFDKLRTLLAEKVSFAGKTVYLANDVDFDGVSSFTPIGYNATDMMNPVQHTVDPTAFDGTFDGLGHKVDNLTLTMSASNTSANADFGGLAFFGVLNGATIKNFIIGSDCSFTYTADPHDHGCVAGFAIKTIATSFDNCMNMATLENGSRFTGGLVARWYGAGSITNCTNVGDLSGCQAVGGMVGYQHDVDPDSPLEITNCRNVGDLTVAKGYGVDNLAMVGSNHSVGAMVSWSQSDLTVDGCINNGFIEGIDNVGGLVGESGVSWKFSALTIKNSIDYGRNNVNDPKEGGNNGKKAEDGAVYASSLAMPTLENNQELRGETDPTLIFYEVSIGLRDASELPETSATVAAQTTAAVTTAAPTAAATTAVATTAAPTTAAETTATPTTVATTTAAPTAAATTAAATTAAPTEAETTAVVGDGTMEESGCQSTVIGGLAVILLASGAAVTMFKKKED